MSGPSTHWPFIQCAFCGLYFLLATWINSYSHNTFASAGGDGTVSIWDHTAKKRLRQYPKYAISVQDIAFNVDGSRLAVGVSYGWENGAEQAAKSLGSTHIYVREVGDEVKVRTVFMDLFLMVFSSISQS